MALPDSSAAPRGDASPIDVVLGKLSGVRQRGTDQWHALCPAHDDNNPSLSVSTSVDGRVLLHCFVGCDFESICTALDLTSADLRPSSSGRPPFNVPAASKKTNGNTATGKQNASRPSSSEQSSPSTEWELVATYAYDDLQGRSILRKNRYLPPGGKKTFRWEHLNGSEWRPGEGGHSPSLYHQTEVSEAAKRGERVFVCEGEKDADRLVGLGFTATTSPDGAGSWTEEHAESLRGAEVIIFPDNDKGGADMVAQWPNLRTLS